MPPNEDDLKQAVETLAKLKPGFLPLPVFLQISRLTVTASAELIVFNGPSVYLTSRDKGDPFWPGMLHTPGAVLLATDTPGDDLDGPINRLIKTEFFDVKLKSKIKLLKTSFRQTERGRELVSVFWASGEGGYEKNWYPVKDVPSLNIFPGHIDLIAEAAKKRKDSQ